MGNKYKELFDKIAPLKSDDELLSAVLDGKVEIMNEKKHFNKRAVIIPAIAVAILICTTVGVSAANKWDLSAALADIFNKSAKKTPDNVTFKEFNFEAIGGKELNDTLKFDGYEVQFKGVTADPHNFILFYDVVIDDPGFKLQKNEKLCLWATEDDMAMSSDYYFREGAAGTPEDPAGMSFEESRKKIGLGGSQRNIFLGAEGNVAHFYLKCLYKGVSCSGDKAVINIGCLDKEITNSDGSTIYEDLFGGDSKDDLKEYEINFDFVDEKSALDFMPDTEIALSTGDTGTITHVQLTPLSVCFRVDWGLTPVEDKCYNDSPDPNAIDAYRIYDEFKIRFKDGTIMDGNAFLSFEDGAGRGACCSGHYNDKGVLEFLYAQDAAFEWLYPVDIADIDALIIGTSTLSVN